MDKADKVV